METTKKYELLKSDRIKIKVGGVNRELYRIRALRTVMPGSVQGGLITAGKVINTGDLGGYIEKEENLSHRGGCWVDPGCRICEDAMVRDEALIEGDSIVCGGSIVCHKARVSGLSEIMGRTIIGHNSAVHNSRLYNVVVLPGSNLEEEEILGEGYSDFVLSSAVSPVIEKVVETVKSMSPEDRDKLFRELTDLI